LGYSGLAGAVLMSISTLATAQTWSAPQLATRQTS
jgi:hypothetical protein